MLPEGIAGGAADRGRIASGLQQKLKQIKEQRKQEIAVTPVDLVKVDEKLVILEVNKMKVAQVIHHRVVEWLMKQTWVTVQAQTV